MKIKYQGIYGFFDKDGSCWYIGQSMDIETRWSKHKKYIHDEWHNEMQSRLDDFTFKILELVDDIAKLREREDYYIDLYNPKYTSKAANKCSQVGPSWNSGKTGVFSQEVLAKISASHKGKHLSEEHKEKLSALNKGKHLGENNPNFGKHLSDETKAKMSAAKKSKHLSGETKTKMSASQKVSQNRPEIKAKHSAAAKGENNGMFGKGYLISGENNGCYGTTFTWMHDDERNYRVPKGQEKQKEKEGLLYGYMRVSS